MSVSTYVNESTRIIRAAAIVVGAMLCGGLSGTASAQHDDRFYKQPKTPILLPPMFPAVSMLQDAEVDDFIQVVQARMSIGVTGRGLTVAVIDTGINPDHVDFQGKIIPGKNFSDAAADFGTTDFNGHGSNVAGIIAGRMVDLHESLATRSMHTGIAPDAKIIPLKVFPGGGFDKINAALEWVVEHQSKHDISVVNMSLGSDDNFNDVSLIQDSVRRSQLKLIEKLREMKVVVTVAAGNHYKDFNPVQGMGFPAICRETLSVGAIFDKDLQPQGGPPLQVYEDGSLVNFALAGRCTPFTQRLSSEEGKRFRTDIFAPGFHVTSAGPAIQADPAAGKRNQTVDDGTSQASPVTAGVVLLLQQRYRDRLGANSLPPVDLIEECLREGGQEFVDLNDAMARKMANVVSTGAGFRRLNALGSLKYLDKKLDFSATRPQAIALLQKRYQDLLGVSTPAPESLIQKCLEETGGRDQINADKALRYLEKRFSSEVTRIRSNLLQAKPAERPNSIRGSSILQRSID